jgi:putative heme-binding domain-containing protein
LVERPKLVGANVEQLLGALKVPENWTREMARLVLKERGQQEVLPALTAWTARIDAADPAPEPLLLDTLWTYQALNVVEPKLLTRLLKASGARVRAAAVRVTSAWHDRLPDAFELIAARAKDEHPQVRLEAACALRQIASASAAKVAMSILDKPMDKFLDYALWQTMRELAPQWLPALRERKFDYGKNVRGLLFALKAVGTPDVVKPLLDLVEAGVLPADSEESVLTLIATLGAPADLRLILDRVVAENGSAVNRRALLLTALGEASKRRGIRPAGDLNSVIRLIDSPNDALRTAALRICGQWKLQAASGRVLAAAQNNASADNIRFAAIDTLAALGGDASRDALDHLSAEGPVSSRRAAAIALVGLDAKRGARGVVALLESGEAGDPTELFDAVLQRKSAPPALAAALEGKKIGADVAKIGIRCIRTSARDFPALVDALTTAGNLSQSGPRVLSIDEMRKMVAAVAKSGDPVRGEAVFRRKDLSCLKCHAIAGAGGQVGPDLSSIGASAQVDYLIDSLLQPNKAVKEGYHATLVTTRSGKLFTGIKLKQTGTELVLRGADDMEIVIPARDIEEQAMGGSLMPDGLTDAITQAEFLDLVRFLSELGKVGPFSVSKARLVRRWQILEATPAANEAAHGGIAAVVQDTRLLWVPAYSSVDGILAAKDIPEIGGHHISYVRCQLEVTTPGKIALHINNAAGLTVWLDRSPEDVKESMVLVLARGLHTFTFAINQQVRSDGLRIELVDVPDSRAKARVVGGK